MKKVFLLILIISTHVFGQKKVGNDVFKMEFLRKSDNIQGDLNNYYSDLIERSMFSKKDSLHYGFLNSKGKTVIEAKYTYASDFFNGKSNIIIDSIPGILFKDGNEKMFPNFNATYWYKDNLGLAIKDKKYGFINKMVRDQPGQGFDGGYRLNIICISSEYHLNIVCISFCISPEYRRNIA